MSLSKLKLGIVSPVYADHHLHIDSVCGLFVLYPPPLEKLLKVLPKSVDRNERQVVQFEHVQKPYKNRLHSHKMVFSVLLVLNQSIVSREKTTKVILGMLLIDFSLLRQHKRLPFLYPLVWVYLL